MKDSKPAKNVNVALGRRRAWETYGDFLHEALRAGYQDRYDVWADRYETYAQFGAVFGGFSDDLAARLKVALAESAPEPYRRDSVNPQFEGTEMPDDFFAGIDEGTEFYRPSEESLWCLTDIAESLAEQIAQFIGSPWRILCARAWKMTSQSGTTGPNEWHVDGLPSPLAKLMIFPQAVGPEIGTTEIQFPDQQTLSVERDGPTWLLFKSSEILHRGVRPLDAGVARYTAEFTIVPSPKFGLQPTFGGSNARQPHYPWLRSPYSRY